MEYGKRIRAKSNQAISGCTTRKDAERLGIRSFFEFVLEDQGIFNIIWESLYIDKTLFDDFYTTFSKFYVSRLKKAQESGEVRDIDPQVLSYVLMGITNFVALNSLVLKQEKNIDFLVDEVMKVLEKGIFTWKNRKAVLPSCFFDVFSTKKRELYLSETMNCIF